MQLYTPSLTTCLLLTSTRLPWRKTDYLKLKIPYLDALPSSFASSEVEAYAIPSKYISYIDTLIEDPSALAILYHDSHVVLSLGLRYSGLPWLSCANWSPSFTSFYPFIIYEKLQTIQTLSHATKERSIYSAAATLWENITSRFPLLGPANRRRHLLWCIQC